MAITFKVQVKKVEVKEKVEKEGSGEDAYEVTRKVGKLTLEFDGDAVRVDDVVALINGAYVILGLANSQLSLDALPTFAAKVEAELRAQGIEVEVTAGAPS